MDSGLNYLILILSYVALITTLYNAIFGFAEIGPKWLMAVGGLTTFTALLVIVPWHLGAYARGEINPIPWVAYSNNLDNGSINALFSFNATLFTDLWILWVPSRIKTYFINKKESTIDFINNDEAELVRKYRPLSYLILLNITLGVTLMQQNNIFYRFLSMFFQGS